MYVHTQNRYGVQNQERTSRYELQCSGITHFNAPNCNAMDEISCDMNLMTITKKQTITKTCRIYGIANPMGIIIKGLLVISGMQQYYVGCKLNLQD
jgi:hypothetical protein